MSILIYLLLLAESALFIILFLPFGVLAYAEIARREPWQADRVLPGSDQPGARMTRWHIVAAIFVILSAIIIPIRHIVGLASSGSLAVTELPPVLDLSLIEVSLWLVTLSALYGPMYAVRLHSQGVHGAVLIGLGLCLFPATLLAVTSLELVPGPVSALAFGVVGTILFPLGTVMPGRRVRTVALTFACVMMLIALSDFASPANPVWLLAAIAMGYTVFRAESKHLFMAHLAKMHAAGRSVLTLPKRAPWKNSKFRTVLFLVVNLACVLALFLTWLIVFGPEESLPAAVFAVAAMSIAAAGALLTALAPTAFGHSRSEIDQAATTFVVVLAAASVVHLSAAPRVEGWVFGDSQLAQLWKPVLAVCAVGGALAIAYATLSGWLVQTRPLMIAIVLPAASLLPSDSFFTFLPEDPLKLWDLRLIETGITVIILAIMWYVFGPGRRTVSKPMGAAHQVESESSASTDLTRIESTANSVTDAR